MSGLEVIDLYYPPHVSETSIDLSFRRPVVVPAAPVVLDSPLAAVPARASEAPSVAAPDTRPRLVRLLIRRDGTLPHTITRTRSVDRLGREHVGGVSSVWLKASEAESPMILFNAELKSWQHIDNGA